MPKENLLHEIGRGHIVAFNTLNAGRFSLGAYCLGGSKKVLEVASKYAKERTAFGKSIAQFGLIRAKLGEMAIRIFAARIDDLSHRGPDRSRDRFGRDRRGIRRRPNTR